MQSTNSKVRPTSMSREAGTSFKRVLYHERGGRAACVCRAVKMH